MRTVVGGRVSGQYQQVLIEDGIITKIGRLTNSDLEGAALVDTAGEVYPGFIDVHIHGGGGAEVMDASEEAFEQIAVTHAQHGTTGLLLTTVTHEVARIEAALTAYQPGRARSGSEILGFHVEGPFISCDKAGAQPKEFIIPPKPGLFARWMALSQGTIRLITVAPEVPGARALFEAAQAHSVVVTMGHSNATAAEASEGVAWGAKSVTHLFNAMTSALHREPGLAGTALGDDGLMVELIADLIHVHPLMLKASIRAKGVEKVMHVTDAVRAATMEDGTYQNGDRTVTVKRGAVRLADGTLAGSTLTLDRAVKNLIRIGAIDPEDVGRVTSLNQSLLFGFPHGRLEVGAPGSVVAINSDWDVTHTVVRGRLVYQR